LFESLDDKVPLARAVDLFKLQKRHIILLFYFPEGGGGGGGKRSYPTNIKFSYQKAEKQNLIKVLQVMIKPSVCDTGTLKKYQYQYGFVHRIRKRRKETYQQGTVAT
jgi:hypothetical protein